MRCVLLCASLWVAMQTSYWELSVWGRISRYVVSELLEGETLRERLRSGSIAVRKVLDYELPRSCHNPVSFSASSGCEATLKAEPAHRTLLSFSIGFRLRYLAMSSRQAFVARSLTGTTSSIVP